MSAWGAILTEHSLTPYGTEIEFEMLDQQEMGQIWNILATRAAFWGLSHETSFAAAIEAQIIDYEETAPEAIRHGVAVPAEAPWKSPNDFYQHCEEMVKLFESERPALALIPRALHEAPAIARRFSSRAARRRRRSR